MSVKQRLGALRVWVNCNVIYFCLQNLQSWMYSFYSSGLLLYCWPYDLVDLITPSSLGATLVTYWLSFYQCPVALQELLFFFSKDKYFCVTEGIALLQNRRFSYWVLSDSRPHPYPLRISPAHCTHWVKWPMWQGSVHHTLDLCSLLLLRVPLKICSFLITWYMNWNIISKSHIRCP